MIGKKENNNKTVKSYDFVDGSMDGSVKALLIKLERQPQIITIGAIANRRSL